MPTEARARRIEVNPGVGNSTAKHRIARARIAMADDFAGVTEARIGRRVVEVAQQARSSPDYRRGEVAQVAGHLAIEVREDLPAELVDSKKPRGSMEVAPG